MLSSPANHSRGISASTTASERALSDAVKAQWGLFMTQWYDVRRNDPQQQAGLADAAQTEWFRRLSQARLQPEYWKMTKDEQATVSQLLGLVPKTAFPEESSSKKPNSNLVENIFGPAAWKMWQKESAPPPATGPPRPPPIMTSRSQPSSTNPSPTTAFHVGGHGRTHQRARAYSLQNSAPSFAPAPAPAAASTFAHVPDVTSLYYISSLAPSIETLTPSFTLSSTEANELHARLGVILSKLCPKKIIEFYKSLCEITLGFQHFLVKAQLDFAVMGSKEKLEEVTRHARKHFDNDVKSLAFRKTTEIKEAVVSEMKRAEREFLKRRDEMEAIERKKWEEAVEKKEAEEKKKREIEEKKRKGMAEKEAKKEAKKKQAQERKKEQQESKNKDNNKHDKNDEQQNEEQSQNNDDNFQQWTEQETPQQSNDNSWGQSGWGEQNGGEWGNNDANWGQLSQGGWGDQASSPSAPPASVGTKQQPLEYAVRRRSRPVRQGFKPAHDSEILFNISNSPPTSSVAMANVGDNKRHVQQRDERHRWMTYPPPLPTALVRGEPVEKHVRFQKGLDLWQRMTR